MIQITSSKKEKKKEKRIDHHPFSFLYIHHTHTFSKIIAQIRFSKNIVALKK